MNLFVPEFLAAKARELRETVRHALSRCPAPGDARRACLQYLDHHSRCASVSSARPQEGLVMTTLTPGRYTH
jgi:hypothetical protein